MTNVPPLESRLTLPRAWRYRCFGRSGDSSRSCGAAATTWAPDPARNDAATFYCDEHAPIGAEPIAEDRPFVAVELGATIVVGGATASVQDARREAVSRATAVLADAGMALHVVASGAGVMAPRHTSTLQRGFGGAAGPRSRRT